MVEIRKYRDAQGRVPFDAWMMGEPAMAKRDKTVPYDPVDYLKTPEDIAEYINAAVEDGNERVMLVAMKDVARAVMGMSELAERTDLSREALYNTLSENGNPRFSSLVEILHALGLELSVKPRGRAS